MTMTSAPKIQAMSVVSGILVSSFAHAHRRALQVAFNYVLVCVCSPWWLSLDRIWSLCLLILEFALMRFGLMRIEGFCVQVPVQKVNRYVYRYADFLLEPIFSAESRSHVGQT
jgi:hypothetical protein